MRLQRLSRSKCYKRTSKYSLNIWNYNTKVSFLLFNEHLVFHKN
ncbi:hypothetical protein OIU76_028925 [Salix suchowensis]|uniref:Uncharacterized protein n=1 Tax=Salix suchowensis TaxID=1278906 RepID=A0ABQ9CD15_9ROSI|nr:hypothetical protein OIU76_028925 [Salix suchowensis]KAJ6397188.1 hypothetical protein OIU77_022099 [Salix suchowensis]